MARNSKFKMILQLLLMAFALQPADFSYCRSEEMAFSKIVNSMGFQLEKMIENRDNYFISPLSISLALAMVYIGARGTTREQMSEALDYNIVGKNCLPNKISENFRQLIRSLRKESNDYSLHLANGAFLQTGYKVSRFYSSNLEKFFHSNVNFLNFEDESFTMNEINEWVANNTKGKIPKILKEPLSPLTVMVLVNAVYFKGSWKTPFNETETKDGLFYTSKNTTKVVPFMTMESVKLFYYDPVKKYKILELEYMGSNISMILILPDNIEELPQYDLTGDLLCERRYALEEKIVTVVMPKFKMAFKRELSKDMINLGMEELFSDRADLTGIRERNDLHVSVMVHKALIEVNERGTEATGTSGLGIANRSKFPSREEFLANHPFLFYIVHNQTNTVLFSGRVVNP